MYSGIGSLKLTKPLSGMMCLIGKDLSPTCNSLSSPFNRGAKVCKYCSNCFMRCGGSPMTLIAVFPAPTPKKVRPGARAFIVAIPAALTGAGRVPVMATPVPSLILLVRVAATASVA